MRPKSKTQKHDRWKLQDAKVRLSELVRQAQDSGPQHVTVHGRDAAVVLSVDDFNRLQHPQSGRDLIAALQTSPLADLDFERISVQPEVRDIDL